ncbi:MAG: U32 family peptidase, partial [Firmicutes bacterium]|nr:U32 family peptidase [Bacillota bacterium]
ILFLKDLEVDGIIAADREIIKFCKDNQVHVHLSTCATNYNEYSCKAYKEVGAKRIVFSRDVGLQEMQQITSRVKEVEWEAFVFNAACRFSESVCLTNHGLFGNLCRRFKNEKQLLVKDGQKSEYVENHGFCDDACGLCEIFFFRTIGITWLKIVERTKPFEFIVDSCKKVKEVVFMLTKYKDEKIFRRKVKNMMKCFDYKNCYYR